MTTTTPDGREVVALTADLSVRDVIAQRVRHDARWLLVLRQYDHGLRGYPDPFQPRRPAREARRTDPPPR